MKSFDQWLLDQAAQPQTADGELLLPEGVIEGDNDGEYLAKCRSCREWTLIYCDFDEIPEVGYQHWCGKSPRCCP